MVESNYTVVCPYCGYDHHDCYGEMVDYDDEDRWSEVTCDHCEKEFRCRVRTTYTYISKSSLGKR